MMGDQTLVTIATFSYPHEAEIARANLTSANIPAFIADSYTVGANSLYTHAIGGVRLQVNSCNKQEAIQLLSQDFSSNAIEAAYKKTTHAKKNRDNAESFGISKILAFLLFIIAFYFFIIWVTTKF